MATRERLAGAAQAILVACLFPLICASVAAQEGRVEQALAMGDTGAAITALRASAGRGQPDPSSQCLLASLLTRTAPAEPTRWQQRVEAQELFETSLRADLDPFCLLEFSILKTRQGMRVDAGRLAARAFALLVDGGGEADPHLLAEFYYRRALPLLSWVRQFQDLVFVSDLAVSTPACRDIGFFCEAYAHPQDFFRRLSAASSLESLVEQERMMARSLLDSALELDADHAGALAGALALASRAGDWKRFEALAHAAHESNPRSVTPLMALVTAAHAAGVDTSAARWFDSLQVRLGPEARARLEGLALVADTGLAERLSGDSSVIYSEAIWGMSDPLYLTPANERRIAHYARVFLAEILFSDPEKGIPGRDTPQGRLIIRYGLPESVFVVKADQGQKLTEAQHAMLEEILACATQPVVSYAAVNRRESAEHPGCAHGFGPGQPTGGGGRWEFWYYANGDVPFLFERALGSWTARHMFETPSLSIDSALSGSLPSSYAPPFRGGEVRSLVTRFPRPDRPALEVWGEFHWDPEYGRPGRYVRQGLFLHSRVTGALVEYAVIHSRPRRDTMAVFTRRLPARWGRHRLAVEGTVVEGDRLGAQQRHDVDFPNAAPGDTLWLSDVLLGDSASAPPDMATRSDVRFFGRADSLYTAGVPVVIYCEVYGSRAGSDGHARLQVRLTARPVGEAGLGPSVVRFFERVLGFDRDDGYAAVWDVARPSSAIVPVLLTLDGLPASERMVIEIEVTDLVATRKAATRRVLRIVPGSD